MYKTRFYLHYKDIGYDQNEGMFHPYLKKSIEYINANKVFKDLKLYNKGHK